MSRIAPAQAHPILPEAWKHSIVALSWQASEAANSYLDMTVQHKDTGQVRRLRFIRPREFRMIGDLPYFTGGLRIGDLRGQQRGEDLRVLVDDFEASTDRIHFRASEVLDLDVGIKDR